MTFALWFRIIRTSVVWQLTQNLALLKNGQVLLNLSWMSLVLEKYTFQHALHLACLCNLTSLSSKGNWMLSTELLIVGEYARLAVFWISQASTWHKKLRTTTDFAYRSVSFNWQYHWVIIHYQFWGKDTCWLNPMSTLWHWSRQDFGIDNEK